MQTLIAHGVAPTDALKLIDDNKKITVVTYFHTDLLAMLIQIKPDAVLFGPDALNTNTEFYELFKVVQECRKSFALDVVFCFYELNASAPVLFFKGDGGRTIENLYETGRQNGVKRRSKNPRPYNSEADDNFREAYGRANRYSSLKEENVFSDDPFNPGVSGHNNHVASIYPKGEATIKACPTLDRQNEDTGDPFYNLDFDAKMKVIEKMPVNNLPRAEKIPKPAKRLTKKQWEAIRNDKPAEDDED